MHVLLFQYPPKPVAAQFSPHVFTCFEQLIFMPSSAFPPPFLLLTNALSTAAVSLTFPQTDFRTPYLGLRI